MEATFAGNADYEEYKKLSKVFADLSLHAELLKERKSIVSKKLNASGEVDEITTYRRAEMTRITADEETVLADLAQVELRIGALKHRMVRDASRGPYPPAPGLIQYARKSFGAGAKSVLGCVFLGFASPKGKGKGASTSGNPGGQ